jgi:hypothetical protein
MIDAHHSDSGSLSPEWQTAVQELDQKFEAVMSAFDELRASMLRLKTAAFGATSDGNERQAPPSVRHDEDASREEVRRAVEEARREMAASNAWNEDTVSHSAEQTLDEADSQPAPEERDEDSDLASAAAAWMRELGSELEVSADDAAYSNGVVDAAGDVDDFARREEVRQAVIRARAEMERGVSFDPPPSHQEDGPPAGEPPAALDEEAVRDEVRRAVEQARSELSSGGLSMFDQSAPMEVDNLQTKPPPGRFDAFKGPDVNVSWAPAAEPDSSLMPASIVIEDPDGRVELARVYDTLNRVERSQAALLNYSPHSVTVGLGLRDRLPEAEVMQAAVVAAFGRSCRVAIDGARMSVKIGDGEEAA